MSMTAAQGPSVDKRETVRLIRFEPCSPITSPRQQLGYFLPHEAGSTMSDTLAIREFSDDLAVHFRDINAEWINTMFRLEETDRDVLENPRAKIIDAGGVILFVEASGLGIVGACALQKTGATSYELTKMGVRESARGRKAGEFLLSAIIDRASSLGAEPLYLLTSSKCAAAIHLYEKLGFQHDAEIMTRYGARYERCDVAMRYHAEALRQAT
jgi:N-acetylglutamate synthase-like GNAT family acetyltransferase